MTSELSAKIINSIGLVFDIVGAVFVTWEVVKQFKGKQFDKVQLRLGATLPPPDKTSEFEQWERNKYKKMLTGLALLFFGFSLQLLSNWWACLF